MSKELSQILSLAHKLDQQELTQLIRAIEELQQKDSPNEPVEFSSTDKDEIRARFAMIDNGETKLSSWEDVKGRVFGK